MTNHNEVLIREKICRQLDTHPFASGPPPVEMRRFKASKNSPYKSPSQMEMKGKSLPKIMELPEGSSPKTGDPAGSLASLAGYTEPEKNAFLANYPSPPPRTKKRDDTPARSPDVLRSPNLEPRDLRIMVADFAEPHRISQDPVRSVGAKPFTHSVHNDPLFGIAEEVHPHNVHDDPTTQATHPSSPHQMNKDPKVPVSSPAARHSVHHDPTVKVAEKPTKHSVHDDQQTKVVDPLHDHRLSQDPVVPVNTRTPPHRVHDDQTAGTSRPGEPASHRLSGDPIVPGESIIAPHKVHDDPMVKVAESKPKQHTIHNDAATKASEGKPRPHQLEEIGRSTTAPAEFESNSAGRATPVLPHK